MPKCEQCQVREAQVRLEGFFNARRESHFFCKQCAEVIKQAALSDDRTANGSGVLGNVFGGRAEGGEEATATDHRPPKLLAQRYVEMWNTGETAIADTVLAPGWLDHAHPEVRGLAGVREAVRAVRGASPDFCIVIDRMLGDGNLVAVQAGVQRVATEPPSPVLWLFRVAAGRLAEMWTYRPATQ